MLTIREAARRLGCDRNWLSGWLAGKQVALQKAGTGLILSEADYRKAERWLRKRRRERERSQGTADR